MYKQIPTSIFWKQAAVAYEAYQEALPGENKPWHSLSGDERVAWTHAARAAVQWTMDALLYEANS